MVTHISRWFFSLLDREGREDRAQLGIRRWCVHHCRLGRHLFFFPLVSVSSGLLFVCARDLCASRARVLVRLPADSLGLCGLCTHIMWRGPRFASYNAITAGRFHVSAPPRGSPRRPVPPPRHRHHRRLRRRRNKNNNSRRQRAAQQGDDPFFSFLFSSPWASTCWAPSYKFTMCRLVNRERRPRFTAHCVIYVTCVSLGNWSGKGKATVFLSISSKTSCWQTPASWFHFFIFVLFF